MIGVFPLRMSQCDAAALIELMKAQLRVEGNPRFDGDPAGNAVLLVPPAGPVELGIHPSGVVTVVALLRQEVASPPLDGEELHPAARVDRRPQVGAAALAGAIGQRVDLAVAGETE